MNQKEIEREREQKLKLLSKVATDSQFIADIEKVKEIFRFSDKEAMVIFPIKRFRNK